jgi:general secretion pathway protein B
VSYILEALKKLEQKRQQGETPSLLTLQGDIAQVHKKRSHWPYITIGVVLLNGIIVLLLFWVAPWKNTGPPPPPQSHVTRESTLPPSASVTVENKEKSKPDDKMDVTLLEKKVGAQPAPSQPPTPVPGKALVETTQPKAAPVQPSPPIKTVPESSPIQIKPVKPSNRLLSIKELPSDIKGSLPELKMTVHSYNEQAQARFAVVNNTTVREGQFVNGELKVEQITPNGVIFNYRGHRFLLQIDGNP